MSDPLEPCGLQHTRPPCPSPTLRAYSNSCPSCQWCHPTTHSLSSPSPPAFNLSQNQGLFQWVNSSHQVGVSSSASVLPMNIQDRFPLGLAGLISFQSKGLSRVLNKVNQNTDLKVLKNRLCNSCGIPKREERVKDTCCNIKSNNLKNKCKKIPLEVKQRSKNWMLFFWSS